jgi:hypothetical protein
MVTKGEYAWIAMLNRELDREAAALRRRHAIMRPDPASSSRRTSGESHGRFLEGSAHVPVTTIDHGDGTESLYSFGRLILSHAGRAEVAIRADGIIAALDGRRRGPVERAVRRPARLERMADL